MDDPSEAPVEIPHTHLSDAALRGVVEAFVLREGTDYGDGPVTLAQKVAQVVRQLERGDAQILYDPASASTEIVVLNRNERRRRDG